MTEYYESGGLSFEWDVAKAASNFEKHGVTFYEATWAFLDENALQIPDLEHSQDENRIILIGRGDLQLLMVAHVERGHRTRIISARRAEAWERKAYEQASR